MASLAAAYPNLVRKETLLEPSELRFFQNHSSQMAALDYFVSLESDIFVPTYDGDMAKVVEGHRRKLLVDLIDQYNAGSFTWNEFSAAIKEAHTKRMGNLLNNNNNIPSEIPQVGSGEGRMYADLTTTS